MKILLLTPIRFYKYAISPLMAGHCRFSPTCSTYAEEAIQQHGMLKGSYLASKRILRCHPWGVQVMTLCLTLSFGFQWKNDYAMGSQPDFGRFSNCQLFDDFSVAKRLW
jgi:putative membrane protein insertion efficiency factor